MVGCPLEDSNQPGFLSYPEFSNFHLNSSSLFIQILLLSSIVIEEKLSENTWGTCSIILSFLVEASKGISGVMRELSMMVRLYPNFEEKVKFRRGFGREFNRRRLGAALAFN